MEAINEKGLEEVGKVSDKLQLMSNEFDEKVIQMKELVDIQGKKGNWDYNDYMRGMYNGMELMLSIVEERDPVYKD